MRIGYVLNRFPRFSQTFVLNEILELERRGHRVDIFSLAHPPDEPRQPDLARLKASVTYLPGLADLAGLKLGHGLEIQPAGFLPAAQHPCSDPLFAGLSEADARRLEVASAIVASHIRQWGITHLHAHFGTNQTTVALLAARMAGISYSWTAHARDLYLTFGDAVADREMRRRKIEGAAFVVAVSEFNRQLLAGICPGHAPRLHRLYNGIDLDACRPGNPRAGHILAAGRLVEKKGFVHLIEACGRLRDNGIGFECQIIGDGPQRQQLQSRIEEMSLQEHVRLCGYASQAELFAAMRRTSLFVLPCIEATDGDRDGLPTVLLEAMGHALPVISSPVTGVPEIIEDGHNGLLTPQGDATALAAAITKCLKDPPFSINLGQTGRAIAARKFDLSQNAGKLINLFAGVHGETRS